VRRLLVLAAVLVVAVLVQSTILARLRLAGVRPDLLVLAVVAVALATDATTGAGFGCRLWSGRPPGSPWAPSGCT
jgi:hypothetical protein